MKLISNKSLIIMCYVVLLLPFLHVWATDDYGVVSIQCDNNRIKSNGSMMCTITGDIVKGNHSATVVNGKTLSCLNSGANCIKNGDAVVITGVEATLELSDNLQFLGFNINTSENPVYAYFNPGKFTFDDSLYKWTKGENHSFSTDSPHEGTIQLNSGTRNAGEAGSFEIGTFKVKATGGKSNIEYIKLDNINFVDTSGEKHSVDYVYKYIRTYTSDVVFRDLDVVSGDNIIKNLTINTSYDKVITSIETNGDIEIKDALDNNTLKTSASVKTGDKINIDLGDQNAVYKVSALGDIASDGNIKINDVAKLYRYVKGRIATMDDEYVNAGDITGDGAVNSADVTKLYNYMKGEQSQSLFNESSACSEEGAIKNNTMYPISGVPLINDYINDECRIDGIRYETSSLLRNFKYEICENGNWKEETVASSKITYSNLSWFDGFMTIQWSYEFSNGTKIYSPNYKRTCSREFTFDTENINKIIKRYRDEDTEKGDTSNPLLNYYNGTANTCNNGGDCIPSCYSGSGVPNCASSANDVCDNGEKYCGPSYSLKVEGDSDVLIIAPHAVRHVRNSTDDYPPNSPKTQELYTDLICEVLAKETNSSCFSKNWNNWTDANSTGGYVYTSEYSTKNGNKMYMEKKYAGTGFSKNDTSLIYAGYNSDFNDTVKKIIEDKGIKLVLTIHGCGSCKYPFNIGTAGGVTLNGRTSNKYLSQLIDNLDNVPFVDGNQNITFNDISYTLASTASHHSKYSENIFDYNFYNSTSAIENKAYDSTDSAAILLEIQSNYRSASFITPSKMVKLKETLSALINYVMKVRNTNTVAVSGLTLNKTSETVYTNKTKTTQLTATISPSNASNKSITWDSSDTSVATVDKNGKVTFKSPGKAIITAIASGRTASYTVTVKEKVILVITASFGINISGQFSLDNSGKTNFVSKNGYTYKGCSYTGYTKGMPSTFEKCSFKVIYYPGSGFDFQYGEIDKGVDTNKEKTVVSGKLKAKEYMNTFYETKKAYTEFYVFFTFPSNSTYEYGCSDITNDATSPSYTQHAQNYKAAIQYLRSGGYNVTAYLGSHAPVQPSANNGMGVVYSNNNYTEACTAKKRSNVKLLISDWRIRSILENGDYDLTYLEILKNFIVNNGTITQPDIVWKPFSWKDYATNATHSVSAFYTTDGLHFSNYATASDGSTQKVVDAYMHSMLDVVPGI